MKPYKKEQEIKGRIVQYGRNEYRMVDQNGIPWYTDEATVDGYRMRDYKKEEKK